MKLRDIIEHASPLTLSFDFGWMADESGHICPKAPVDNLTLDTEVEVLYYWYHHLDSRISTEDIGVAIENHDYAAFMKWYREFREEPLLYFPNHALIFTEDTPIGQLEVVVDQKLFAMISGQDFECG